MDIKSEKYTDISGGVDSRGVVWLIERVEGPRGRIYLFSDDTYDRAFLGEDVEDEGLTMAHPDNSGLTITESTPEDLRQIGAEKQSEQYMA